MKDDSPAAAAAMPVDLEGADFVVGEGARRTLVLRDSRHQYVFEEQ